MARWFVDRQAQQGIPSVSLRRLLPDARFVGAPDWEVSGCTADSRRLDPGQVFVAVRGSRYDGHAFVAQALERGAAGVVVERPCPEAGRLQVVVPDTRAAYSRLCQALAGDPSRHLVTLGVTGSCGRTLAAHFLRAILEAAGERFGMVGRLGWSDGVETHPIGLAASMPDPAGLAAMLAAMVEHGAAGAVIELGSEALGRGRVIEGVSFDGAIVTDLAAPPAVAIDERLARRSAKARLFRQVKPGGAAVVNADDPQAELLGAVNLEATRVSYSLRAPADVTARIEQLDRRGCRFLLRGFDHERPVMLHLAGESSVSHALAASALAWARGVAVDAVVAGLESVLALPGRLEPIEEGQAFDVRVDQARQGVDLQEALAALRSMTDGRIRCVLGAEGNRDRRERRGLAIVAESFADGVILTADNPRTEDPDQILDDLLTGFRHPGRVRVEPDRRLAIEAALAHAEPGDAVLIAGKGRQTFQILADRAVPFDDCEVARTWLHSHRPVNRRSA
jgi:UDP-N-acetylmuramoyl-L-alanyl-D-glutamate--2,6-diaminopimelate ligase